MDIHCWILVLDKTARTSKMLTFQKNHNLIRGGFCHSQTNCASKIIIKEPIFQNHSLMCN